MKYLIGVDDTDNLKTRGTGLLVRRLALWLQLDRLAEAQSITRHQLLVDPRIPYTSHNSTACLLIDVENVEAVWETARDLLVLEAASGADVGLCLGRWDAITNDVIALGRRAKVEIVALEEAQQVAARAHVRYAGLTGDGGGVIGALAAIGLHRDGNDGRFLWLPGLHALHGKYTVAELRAKASIDRVCSLDGADVSPEEVVDVGEWPRPVLRDGQATLIAEEKKHIWYALDRERIKNLSK